MSNFSHLESSFDKAQAGQSTRPDGFDLVSLSGGSNRGDSPTAHFTAARFSLNDTSAKYLPKMELGGTGAPSAGEQTALIPPSAPAKPGGGSARTARGGKKITGAPDWNPQSGASYSSAASSADSNDTSSLAAAAGQQGSSWAGIAEGSWARNSTSAEGGTATALPRSQEGSQAGSQSAHADTFWSDERASHHAAGAASTDEYNAQQQGDSDSPTWNNIDQPAQQIHSSDDAAAVASDASSDLSSTNVPIDTLTNDAPISNDTSEEPTTIETSSTPVNPASAAAGGNTGGASGASGASQQSSSASNASPTNDAGAGVGVPSGAAVSQQAANLMTNFPTVAITNSPTQSPTNSTNATAAAAANTPSSGTVPADAAIGPNGNVVGSTATVFGPSAMPAEAAPTGPAYYVSADGSATGTGTEANPFDSLQQAANAMAGSDIKTAVVEGGTYDQSAGLTLTSADSGESFIGNGSATLNGEGTAGNLISVNGANNISVEGLNLTNTANNPVWSSSDWFGAGTGEDAILAQNTSGDNFSYNNISNAGMAMNFQGVTDSQVDGNNISNVQQAVIITQGNSGSSGNTLAANSIENVNNVTGVMDDNQGAINLVGDSNDTVSNNVIQSTAAAGISITTLTSGDTVNQNTVQNTNTAATPSSSYEASATNPSDMGAIYAWSGAGNTTNQQLTISDNYVQNAGQGFENNGIYLDDGVSGATVTGNIVQGAGAGGASFDVLVHGGSDDTIANNILNLDSASGQEKGVFVQSDGYAMTGNSITDNTLYANGANGGAIDTLVDSNSDIPALSGNDYYGVSVPSIDPGAAANNPGYVSPDTGNYSLAANAAAPIIADNAPPTAPSVSDNTETTTATTGSDNTGTTTATIGPDNSGTTSDTTLPSAQSVSGTSVAADYNAYVAAADAISAQPTSPESMGVGSTGDPAVPGNVSNLPTITINGDSQLSQLSQDGTLTQNADGSWLFDGNGQQVNPLVLNGVSGLTIENSVFADTGSSAGVTITGDSNNNKVVDSSFSDVGTGVEVMQSNNVDPSNTAVEYDSFNGINGPFPEASAAAFDFDGPSSTAAAANGDNVVAFNTVNYTSVNPTLGLNGQDIFSFYRVDDGSNSILYGNSVIGSQEPSAGGLSTGSAGNFEQSENGIVANNYATNGPSGGYGNNGSENVNYIGNLVTKSIGSYEQSAEAGGAAPNGQPSGTWTYNNSDQQPENGAGWPEVYTPNGQLNSFDTPGNTNNWNTDTTASDNTPPATPTTAVVTPNSSTPPESTTAASSTPSSLFAADMAAADAISAQPTSEATMNVGATGDPTLPANLQSLSALTINGDSGLSALSQYGTLTESSDGSYTFNGNGQQVAPLNLNGVDNLTITNAVFADAGSTTGGLTISGDSNDVVVSNSTFSGDQYGINVDASNNVDPTNIGIINNSFSNMDGLFPDGSPIQFLGAGASGTPAAPNGENLIANNTINGTEQAVGSENGIDLLSIYNYANGANNADTLVYGNSISGSLQLDGGGQTSGAGIIAELDPGTTGTPTVTAANNFITGQTGSGLGNGGSDADFIGNLVTNSTGDVGLGSEGGYNATGEYTFNATDNSPVVPVAQNQGGWPVVYAPDGPPNDPGNTNSWDV
jgi:hypothetical protein